MSVDSADKNSGNSYEYRLKEVSDEEIISILRFRDHFQKHAVTAAIKEALKRGIISSIEDLEKEEFKPLPITPKSIFPIGNTYIQTIAIFKSLCRIFYIFGSIPIIYGISQLLQKVTILANTFILLGLIIIYIANRLEKLQKPLFAQFLLAINIPAIGFAVFKLSHQLNKPTIMDMLAVSIILSILLYTTLYANKLVNYFTKNNGN